MKRTALYPDQAALHAKFGPFGGWELPLFYSSILDEHRAVRTSAGLFDVSHLGHLEVSGPEAQSQLQPLVTQDLTRLEPGRAVYTPMLNPQGGILDEMIFYRPEPDRFRLVVNAANGEKVLSWLKGHFSSSVSIQDLRDQVGTLAVQGPKGVRLVERLAHLTPAQAPRYSIRAGQIAGRKVLLARTGYTGEDGFELFVGTQDLILVWNRVLEEGKSDSIQPVGLGARDTLRLEAGLPLGGSDLDETITPLEAGLDWTVAWGKGPFVGREVLERQKREGVSRCLVGFLLKGNGIPRHGYPILSGGREVGRVTSGTFLPAGASGPGTAARAIGMGYVPPTLSNPGTSISIQIHDRPVPAEVVRLPFYRRKN
ncbi:MAG: glycine cleavage system aminomethyltransferase GcvT [Candidatus Omnitrophica bacterium]|nr:glycine cleavage system aminomethyltransferase GcvT [Candidatus Omnitrophota bacterium]